MEQGLYNDASKEGDDVQGCYRRCPSAPALSRAELSLSTHHIQAAKFSPASLRLMTASVGSSSALWRMVSTLATRRQCRWTWTSVHTPVPAARRHHHPTGNNGNQ
ncbi:hypothetical protein C2845_PM13G21500 [Panicum miliaceum]|uniref:Uncharacterized protein n=1 Tax=Panicum miliaceum TaxID=4540 RepID=A0A3L6RJ43_PANMI|nr:hypothetical protein C2845_PM13G21500 [Panicum miliaceum]